MRIALLTLTGIIYSLLIYGTYLWLTVHQGIHPLLTLATFVATTIVTSTALHPTSIESPQ